MDIKFPIYHVIVVGFHHKRGCQVEFAFPPLEKDLETTAWKYLPTLAMPDGAHNFDHDTVYFHLPSLVNPKDTVFGVACYQQIDADKVKNKTDDVTRSTVQKSVCVLSRFPLYGHIQVKMALITAAYFREGDFQNISLLEEAYHNLNACLSDELLRTPEAFVGLSPRELVFTFRRQIITLFKLLLLEKKILFRGASVGPLCSALLTLVSLLPLTVEYGLGESACVRPTSSRTYSIVPEFSNRQQEDTVTANDTRINPHQNNTVQNGCPNRGRSHNTSSGSHDQNVTENLNSSSLDSSDSTTISAHVSTNETTPTISTSKKSSPTTEADKSVESLTSDTSYEKTVDVPDFLIAVQMSASEAGLPLELFTKNYLCHPYLSLNYLDLLSDPCVKGFIVGATNVLFKQKKDLVDVIVEMQDGTIDIADQNLKRIVSPTTQDLRFVENIVNQVTQQATSDFMDGVGWEGGDEWIRAQFRYYLICMMRTSLLVEESRLRDCFNKQYLEAWQSTHNWTVWNEYVNSDARDTPGIYAICPGHPNNGNISIDDMTRKISYTMQNTKGGQAINHAVASTGRAVAQTGKAVGGALTQAKGAIASFFSQLGTPDLAKSPSDLPSPTAPKSTTESVSSPTMEHQKKHHNHAERQAVFHIDNID